jgi:hypothetical protein
LLSFYLLAKLLFTYKLHRQPLPDLLSSVHMENELDRHSRYYRQVELLALAAEAGTLRESATDVGEALVKIDGFLATLKNLAVEVNYISNFSKQFFTVMLGRICDVSSFSR